MNANNCLKKHFYLRITGKFSGNAKNFSRNGKICAHDWAKMEGLLVGKTYSERPTRTRKFRALGIARANSGARMPELPELAREKIGGPPDRIPSRVGFFRADPNFPKARNPNVQPCFLD